MTTKTKIAKAYVSLMVHVAKSDGILDENEENFMYKSTKGFLKRAGVVMEKEEIDEIVKSPLPIQECLASIHLLGHTKLLSIVMQLVLLSHAYDGTSKEEAAVIKTVVDGLFGDGSPIIHRYIEAKTNLYTVEAEMQNYFPPETL